MPENEKGAFLTDLIGEYHREKNKQSLAKDFKKNKQKDVKAFLCALGLGDVLEAFKREKQGKNIFWFYEEETPWVKAVLASKEAWCKCVREQRCRDMTDRDAIALYETVAAMLRRRGFAGEALQDALAVLCVKLRYPVRRLNARIDALQQALERVRRFLVEPHWELPGSLNDELEWLRYVENDLQERVGEYAQLYRQMRELRGDELQALGEEEALSGEGQEALWAEEEISNRTWEIFCALPEARELLAQEDALATNAGTAAEKKLKKGDAKALRKNRERQVELYRQAERKARAQMAAQMGAQLPSTPEKRGMPSAELLKRALECCREERQG